MNAPRPDPPSVREGPLSLGLRLLAGGVSWAREGICRVALLENPLGSPSGRRVWYGVLGAAAGLGPALRSGMRRSVTWAGGLEERARPWLDWVDQSLLGNRGGQRLERLRRSTRDRWSRWEERGRREELAGRWLALRAAQQGIDAVISRASKSPSLDEAIEEASGRVGETTLDEVRERGARADDVAEKILHRLIPRGSHEHGEEPR